MVSSMHNIYTHTHLFWRQHNGHVACLHTCGPHHPRCSFASPGTQQCRKNGINAKLNCPRSVGACPVIPGAACQHTAPAQHSATQQLSSVGVRAIVRCPLAHGASSALRRSTTQQLSERQGSSWVSGLLLGVRAPRRCLLADGGVVKGRRCACARTCEHTPIFSDPQQVQHRGHSTKQLLCGTARKCRVRSAPQWPGRFQASKAPLQCCTHMPACPHAWMKLKGRSASCGLLDRLRQPPGARLPCIQQRAGQHL